MSVWKHVWFGMLLTLLNMVDFRMGNTHKQESLLSHLNLIDFLQASKSFQSIVPVQIREKNQMEFAPMYS